MEPSQQQQQQKDYIPLTSQDLSNEHVQRDLNDPHQNSSAPFSFNAPSSSINPPQNTLAPQFNIDILGNLTALQSLDKPAMTQYTPQMLLEQQFKLNQLQQLQQLQNQIFQQQIALISRLPEPAPAPEPQKDQGVRFHGLPTPGSSTELRAQVPTDFISPMTLHYIDVPTADPYTDNTLTNVISQSPTQADFYAQRGTASAPAHVAFHHSNAYPPPTNELDFDISPLTSPWLGSNPQSVPPPPPSQKRAATNSGDEAANMGAAGKSRRQKISPPMQPINPNQTTPVKKTHRGSKSMTATPLLRSSRSRGGSIANGETPSPVDLSMPPPELPSVSFVSSSSTSMERSVSSSPQTNPTLMPVTPASIMNLGRLGLDTSLVPQPLRSDTAPHARRRSISKPSKHMSTHSSMISPGLKPILPAGTSSPLGGGGVPPPPPPLGPPVMQVRKTSHKAAEQKRRDSLKTTFDDLRVLLPPIPLPSDENYPDEPILPGALPPRGPPKSGGEGPNKAVSKLQLLRCGNDFIRQLKARVQRRDEEIEKLRAEVKRLRGLVDPTDATGGEQLDLEHDLDAVEPPGFILGRGNALGDYEADEEAEED